MCTIDVAQAGRAKAPGHASSSRCRDEPGSTDLSGNWSRAPGGTAAVWIGGFSPVVEAGVIEVLGHSRARVVQVLATTGPAGANLLLLDPSGVPAGVRAQVSDVPTVALLSRATASRIERALEMGAVCVLSLEVSETELVEALEDAQLGRVRHAAPQTGLLAGVDGRLSPRELLVLTKICEGRSNDEIASEMAISINTVKSYVRIAYRKIGTRKRTQAMLWGLEHGLEAPVGDQGPAQTARTRA